MSGRRAAALGALIIGLAATVLAVIVAIDDLPRGLIAVGLIYLAVLVGFSGVLRRGAVRVAGLAAAAVAFAAAILLLLHERLLEVSLIVGGFAIACALARAAVSERPHLSPAAAPKHPVLIFNPKSGGGKAEKFSLATEAPARGIEAIELGPGQDLEEIVRDAVARGADALAMAGGDGSQAIVATIAAELDLPYACIPSGTRNHFALDLGVDRDDVVGALDAFGEAAASAAWTSASSTGACSSTTSPSASTPRRFSVRATGTRRSARSSTRCRMRSGPTDQASICAGRDPAETIIAAVP